MDGTIVPWENATVHVLAHGLHYGTGVFEGIRAYNAKDDVLVFRLKDHFQRMVDSAKIYSLPLPYGRDEMFDAVLSLIKKNDFHTSLYIRPIAFRGLGGISLDARNVPVSVSIISYPFLKYFDSAKSGIDICVSTWRRLGEPAVPAMAKACGHYVNSVLARSEASAAGFDEALFLNKEGNVCEGTGENIFIVKDGMISTPSLASDVLKGITRQTIIELIEDDHLRLSERVIARAELYTCDEAFFTGTAAEVTPILTIDRKPVRNGKPGPVALRLGKEYDAIVTGNSQRYLKHLTSVYGTHPQGLLAAQQ
jgi:branched-chain amino acid aminotransferase